MALVLADRVKETTTTTGTGTYTLSGAVTGFETFGSIGNGNTTYYCCTDGTDFEVGVGTYTSSGTTLARTTILQSSNSDSAVNWSSGTRTIFCTQPADKAVFKDASDDVTLKSSDGAILKLQSSDTTITDGSVLGAIEFSAPDEASGTDAILTAASIVAEADATFAADANNTDLVFKLGASEAASEKMRLTHEGKLEIPGDADIDGTTHLDAVDIDGAVQIDNTVTIGANDQGYDVIFYGDTASANLTWDTSADDLILNGAARIVVPDGQLVLGSTAVSSTAAELNILDGKSFLDEDDMSSDSATGIPSQQSVKAYVDTKVTAEDLDVTTDSGTIAIDLDSETLTIAGGTGLSSSATSNTVTLAVDAAQTGITSLLATDIKIGEDDQTKIDFETADTINFYAGNEKQLILTDGALTPGSNAIVDLGTDALEFKDAYFDGTVEADAITIGGTDIGSIYSPIAGSSSIVTTGALDSGSITSGFGTIDTGSSAITTTGLISGGSLDIDDVLINGTTIGHTDDTDLITLADGVVTVAGEISVTTLDIGGTNVSATAAELNLIDGGTARGTTAVASGDGILINDGGTMRMTNVDTVSTYFSSHNVGGGNIVTTGALNSGSITSGFGAIDIGSSALSTTGSVTLGATSFGDNNITNVGNIALDSITSDGSEIKFGSAGSGEDVYFYSATSGDHMLWDASDEKLVIIGTNGQNALEVTDGNVAITDNLTVSGDLTVSGTTTTIDTTNLTVTDPLIKLAQGTTASPANDLGIIFTRGNGSSSNIANRAILWNESADIFVFANTNDEDGTTTGNVDIDDYASIRVGAITADDNVDVGGNIELGHASDTTIARSSAGVVTIEGVEVTTNTASQTLTNKTLTTPVINGFSGTGNATISSTADGGPVLSLISNDHGDATDWHTEATIKFLADNTANEETEYANIKLVTADVTDGTEDGWVYLATMANGTLNNTFAFSNTGSFLLLSTNDDDPAIQWNNTGGTSYDVKLITATPSADRTITLPDATGTVSLLTATETLTNKTLTSPVINGFSGTGDGALTGDLTLTNTGAGSGANPQLTLYRNSSSPADDDFIGEVIFTGRNDNSEDIDYGAISSKIIDASDGTEDSNLLFKVMSNGTSTTILNMKGNAATKFSEKDISLGQNVDIIFEGASNNAHETTLTVTDPTGDRTVTLPDATGTVITTGNMNSITDIGIQQYTVQLGANADLQFEGATANANETTLTVVDPTADRTITLPDATGTINELLISSGSVSDVSSIDFNNTVITSAFASYRIVLSNVVSASDDVDLMMRLGTSNSADSTSTIYMRRLDLEGAYDSSGSSTATTLNLYDAHGAELDLCYSYAGLGTGTGESGYFEISLVNPNDTSNYKQIGVNSIIYSYYPVLYGSEVDVGLYKTTSAVNFMTVYLSSGNIASADYRVYGAK